MATGLTGETAGVRGARAGGAYPTGGIGRGRGVEPIPGVTTADGALFGPDAGPVGADSEPEESRLLGWDGGRVLVATSQGGCGSAAAPGVHAVDPDAGTSTELTPLAGAGGLTTDRVLPWHRQD